MNDIIIRALSGLVYVLIVFSALTVKDARLWGFVLFSVFYFIQTDELVRLLKLPRIHFFFASAVFWLASSMGIIYAIFHGKFNLYAFIFLFYFILFLFALLLILLFFHFFKKNFKFLAALAYSAVPYAMTLYVLGYEPLLVLFLFIILWIYDTFAYLTGKFFGKHKLAPKISPKKTWEGVIGGSLAVIGIVWMIWKYKWFPGLFYFLHEAEFLPLIPMLIFLILMATIGDLTESYMKRRAGVKDSGNIMPGHGGILDRLDSYLFAIAGFFVYLVFVFKVF
jgi:phosphatidate cytidylyltransferase